MIDPFFSMCSKVVGIYWYKQVHIIASIKKSLLSVLLCIFWIIFQTREKIKDHLNARADDVYSLMKLEVGSISSQHAKKFGGQSSRSQLAKPPGIYTLIKLLHVRTRVRIINKLASCRPAGYLYMYSIGGLGTQQVRAAVDRRQIEIIPTHAISLLIENHAH